MRRRHDTFTKRERSTLMSKIKSKGTRIEITMEKSLRSLGLKPVKDSKIVGNPDFVFPEIRVVVFCDGDFWHGYKFGKNPRLNVVDNRDFWLAKIKRNIRRDAEVNRILSREGWKVLRFWEHDIKADVLGCARRVLEAAGD